MSKYPLAAMLSTRKIREDRAARESRQARAAVEEAKEAAAAAYEKWRAHREWRPGEERRLFESVRGEILSRTELDGHVGDIEALRAAELRLEEAYRAAEQAVTAAEAEAEKARVRHAAAIRDREKIDEHRKLWQREEDKRLEMAEEAELEDFPSPGARDESGFE